MNKKKMNKNIRANFLKTFGIHEWKKIPAAENQKHSLNDCPECQKRFPNELRMLSSMVGHKSKLKSNILKDTPR